MIVEPEVTQNPALPENILLFHQLMGDEVQAIQSFLGAWAAELLRHGLSGGHLFTVVNTGSGRRGPIMRQAGVPPFIAL